MYELKQVISVDSVIEAEETLELLAAGWEPFAIFTRNSAEVLVLKRIVEPQRVIPKPTAVQREVVIPNTRYER